MELYSTRNLKKAIYPYNLFRDINYIGPEEGLPEKLMVINGDDARHWYKKLNTNCKQILLKDCYYIFRYTKEGNLYAKRMTMHPKTLTNYSKGWDNYGSSSFIKGLF